MNIPFPRAIPTLQLPIAAGAAALLLASGPVHAQAARSGGGGSSQIMQQYQQLAAERTQLQTDNAKLKADLAAMTAERDALKKERDALKSRPVANPDNSAAKVAAANQAAEEKLAENRKKTEELVARYRDTATQLQAVEKDRTRLNGELAQKSEAVSQCAAANVKLGDLINEVLNRYENQGWFRKATIDEPFTRLTRNRVESLTTEYRVQASELAYPGVAGAPKPSP